MPGNSQGQPGAPDREAVYSTGFGYGFAVPHCKTRAVTANSVAMLKLRNPVP